MPKFQNDQTGRESPSSTSSTDSSSIESNNKKKVRFLEVTEVQNEHIHELYNKENQKLGEAVRRFPQKGTLHGTKESAQSSNPNKIGGFTEEQAGAVNKTREFVKQIFGPDQNPQKVTLTSPEVFGKKKFKLPKIFSNATSDNLKSTSTPKKPSRRGEYPGIL